MIRIMSSRLYTTEIRAFFEVDQVEVLNEQDYYEMYDEIYEFKTRE